MRATKALSNDIPSSDNTEGSRCLLQQLRFSHSKSQGTFSHVWPGWDSRRGPGLAEVYERHIYMTVDQAIDVARAILMTAQKFQENKQLMEANKANTKIPRV